MPDPSVPDTAVAAPPPSPGRAEGAPLHTAPQSLSDLAQRERFFEAVGQAAARGDLVRVLLSKPVQRDDDLERVTARPLTLRGERCLSFVYRHRTRDLTRNEPLADGLKTLESLVGARFAHAHLFSRDLEWQLMMSRKGRYTLHRGRAEPAGRGLEPAEHADEGHDRAKRRLLALETPFLQQLGVTDERHALVPTMARKWKQINKFVEIMAHALDSAGFGPQAPLHVVDFGAGKGYLTFALHDYLRRQAGGQPRALDIIGVELRAELVALCNDVVARCGLEGLRFEAGDVSSFVPPRLDVMIALHACDTATDHALHTGIRAGAAIIMCSPCCHKQLRPQMGLPAPLAPLLQHGIHLGQEAEMLTDGLRALLLEAHGYDAQVFEFVALEHTSKNKMILAVRRPGDPEAPPMRARRERALAQVAELKRFYGVHEQALETLLRSDVGQAPSPGRSPATAAQDAPAG